MLLATTLADLPSGCFEVIGAGAQAAAKKPAPDICNWVLGELGLPGADCLAVEDSKNGVRAALGASIPVRVTESSWTRRDDFTGVLAVLPDLAGVNLPALRRFMRRGNATRRSEGHAAPRAPTVTRWAPTTPRTAISSPRSPRP